MYVYVYIAFLLLKRNFILNMVSERVSTTEKKLKYQL